MNPVTEKFSLVIDIGEDGSVNIRSNGTCHHIYLIGVLETIKADVMAAAATMQFGEGAKIPGETQSAE